ncbi:hypothetical protein CFP56_010695 [Quercus suber]|uniref:Uncharacterized protein n=1 Tax=Quercus suber TaxID=58331 RepID=A0AAW0L0F3_QUESU
MGEVALASLSSTFKSPLFLHGSRTRCALGKEERKGKQKNRRMENSAATLTILVPNSAANN